MSALDNTPTNRNFLSPLNFEFKVKKLPNVNFFVQKVNFPSLELKSPDTSNPFVTIPYPGEHLTFGPLNVEFKLDEDLQNYLEINRWMIGLGKPETFEQYAELEKIPLYTGDGIYSDVSIMSLSSTKQPNYEVVCVDAFPVKLSEVIFNSIDESVFYLTATVTFKYSYYTINRV